MDDLGHQNSFRHPPALGQDSRLGDLAQVSPMAQLPLARIFHRPHQRARQLIRVADFLSAVAVSGVSGANS